MKSTWSLVLAATAIILFLIFLSRSGTRPPVIPADAAHAGLETNEACAPCHAAGGRSPLRETHPPKEQCVLCHQRGTGR